MSDTTGVLVATSNSRLTNNLKLIIMKIWIITVGFFLLLPTMVDAQIGNLLDRARDRIGLGESEVAAGLKEALEKGADYASETLSEKDGYYMSPYKILLPDEAQSVVSRLSSVPAFRNLEDDLVERINRAAELAAAKAKPIFRDAIRGMTVRDAKDILLGEDDAATRYLHRTTNEQLYAEFLPVIRESLEEVNAVKLWQEASTAYNRLPMVTPVETRLDEHVTHRGLDGLFSMIEEEEKKIRTDVSARTTERLRKVFAEQDDR